MKEMKKRNPDTFSEKPSKKDKGENPDRRHPNPDDPYEEKGPPIKEMPITGGPHHEEIPDRTPK
jgi:hypothetical protein